MASVAKVLPGPEADAAHAEVIHAEGLVSRPEMGGGSHPWECTDRVPRAPVFSGLGLSRWAHRAIALARQVGKVAPEILRHTRLRIVTSRLRRRWVALALLGALGGALTGHVMAGKGAARSPTPNAPVVVARPAGPQGVAAELRGVDRVLVGAGLQLKYRPADRALVIARTPGSEERR